MYNILVTIGKTMTHTRSLRDYGAGPAAVLKEAITAFNDECTIAQYSAASLNQPITVELQDSRTGETIDRRTLIPSAVIDK